MNGGICSEHGEEYVCQCAEGFDGNNCEQCKYINFNVVLTCWKPCASWLPFHFLAVSIEIPPMITEPPVNTFGELFSRATLRCIATGNPSPNILWYKDKNRYSNATADPPILEFQELTLKNRGFYYCEAFNLQGGRRVTVTSGTVILNIEGD